MAEFNPGLEPRYILHVDADAFFVSVEQVLKPKLKNEVVAVGYPHDRGIVCSASYEARQFGIHAGMSSKKAMAICPCLLMIPPNFDNYKFFSQQLFDILEQYSPYTERTSIDEGYIDLTGTTLMWGMPPKDLAMQILKQINAKLKINVSGGLASNKLVSQIASKLYKPHKLIHVPHGYEKKFLWPLPLKAIPGIGPKTSKMFKRKGFVNVGDFGNLPLERVVKEFSLSGVHIWQKIHGLVHNDIQTIPNQVKSISNETTFLRDLDDLDEVRHKLLGLINKVLFRLRKNRLQASVIALKMRSANFHTYTFHRKLAYPTAFDGDIIEEGKFLLRENFHPHSPLRLIGFGVEKLQSEYNLSIFQDDVDIKNRLTDHIDRLRSKHGFEVVSYGV